MTLEDLNTLTQKMRDTRFESSPQITLGELIQQLESIDLKNSSDEYKYVSFDFGSAIPTDLASWRGSYTELSLGYTLTGYDRSDDHFKVCKADEFLKQLKSAVGKSFYGWKGGDFIMGSHTPLWVANPGNSGNTGIIGILDKGYEIVILTAYCEY